MAQAVRFGHRRYGYRRTLFFSARNFVLAVAVTGAVLALGASYRDQIGELTASYTPSAHPAPPPIATNAPTVVKLGVPSPEPVEGAIEARRITVVGGDTIRIEGQTYRLIGFDTPSTGLSARCAAERAKAEQATQRLRDIVAAADGLKFQRVACPCEPGTEGTLRCNDAHLCGALSLSGRDISDILISEGIARPYVCSRTKCPAKQSWC
jgi:endonuclease YncB( thermonuclease family)